MFLNRLFNKSDTLLKAKIEISESSSHFEIIDKASEIKDRELVLMGLLIYARILRVESSKSDKDKLVGMFIEFHTNYLNTNKSSEYLNLMLFVFSGAAKSTQFKSSAVIKLKKVARIYLDMGIINVYPLSSVVYTVFNFVWENISEQYQIRLIESFALLSKMYNIEEFSMSSAVEIPNEIVYEIIAF